MIISTQQLPKSELLITIEIPAEALVRFEDEAAKRVSEHVDVPGFRKGQAPKAFIIAQIGADRFFEEVLNIALPQSYLKAVKEKNLQVISRPEVKVISKSPLKYEAKVATLPPVAIKDLETIKIPEETAEVTEKEIDLVIEDMRRYRAEFKEIDRPVKNGDKLEVDFQGFDEGGAPLDNTKSSNHPLFLGEGSLVAGFEENIIGMKKGEKKKFQVKFPKDYGHAPFQNKMVHFEVELKKSHEPILPELTEEFVEQVMGAKKSVQEFKEAIKSDMKQRKIIDARRMRENNLLEVLLNKATLDVPPSLLNEEIDYMIDDIKRDLEQRGLTLEAFMKKLKDEKKDIRKEYEKESEKRVKVRLILNHLFRELKIEVNDDEMSRAEEKLLLSAPEKERGKVKEDLSKRGEVYLRLKNNLLLEKLFTHFLG